MPRKLAVVRVKSGDFFGNPHANTTACLEYASPQHVVSGHEAYGFQKLRDPGSPVGLRILRVEQVVAGLRFWYASGFALARWGRYGFLSRHENRR